MKPCKICETKTKVVYNVNFKPVPVCEDCARQIAAQEVMDLLKKAKTGEDSTTGITKKTTQTGGIK